MLTAAVRDLHFCYPGQFLTDVRTSCPDIWDNNPHISPLREEDSEVQSLDCTYPLIDRCNETPYHCLHGFIEFLNEKLGLSIKPTAFKGDIHLNEQEKAWYSQVHELTGHDTPFWIVAAGGKYDVTIKWWETSRYQEVLDYFRGKIQFVQVGSSGHHHPKLQGAIDLRGRTTLRELIRLVYHAQGVLCPVTGLMHLAAAVETKNSSINRPCVVVAGAREPAHWEAYPEHQFIHTNGILSCGSNGGCWKDRVLPLRDGNERDNPERLCTNVVGELPRCMDMITSVEVVRRIELYFSGGKIDYLSSKQRIAARRGVIKTHRDAFDQESLNLHNAGMACDRFLNQIVSYPDRFSGRGIVICAGGVRYFTNAWVCIHMLRLRGCKLPIQVWHLGEKEMDPEMANLLLPLGVKCIDAYKMRERFPARILNGWELKAYAMLHSPFEEVLFLDADNVPIVNPEFLFDTPQYRETGAIFWPDYDQGKNEKKQTIWKSCGLRQPQEPEFETGQMVVDKKRCWVALSLCMWFNENSDFYYNYIYGDKETFHLAFRKAGKSYALVPKPVYSLQGTMCQHDFKGRRIFQHRNSDKWDLFLWNQCIKGFRFERECLGFLANLRKVWDGRSGATNKAMLKALRPARRKHKNLSMEAVMISFEESKRCRRQSLQNLDATDWARGVVHVQIEKSRDNHNCEQRLADCAYLALKESLRRNADYILLLEDAVEFNLHIRHNLEQWSFLKSGLIAVAGLCNPGVRELACDIQNNARIVDSDRHFESAAFLFSREAVVHLVTHWKEVNGTWHNKIAYLASEFKKRILFHVPSLVQRIVREPAQGRVLKPAVDFDFNWKA